MGISHVALRAGLRKEMTNFDSCKVITIFCSARQRYNLVTSTDTCRDGKKQVYNMIHP